MATQFLKRCNISGPQRDVYLTASGQKIGPTSKPCANVDFFASQWHQSQTTFVVTSSQELVGRPFDSKRHVANRPISQNETGCLSVGFWPCRLYTSGLSIGSEGQPCDREVGHSADSNPNGLRPSRCFFRSIVVAAETCEQFHELRKCWWCLW